MANVSWKCTKCGTSGSTPKVPDQCPLCGQPL